MANNQEECANLCRFCLWQDGGQLMIIANILNSSFNIEDIQRFTGILINSDDALSCAICLECLSSLQKSTDFRNTCLRNDVAFRQLWSVAFKSEKEVPAYPTQDTDPLEALGPDLIKLEPSDEDTSDRSISIPVLNTIPSQDIARKEDDLRSTSSGSIDEPLSDELLRHETLIDAVKLPDDGKQKSGRIKRLRMESSRSSGKLAPGMTETADKEAKTQNTPSAEGGRSVRVLCTVCGKLVTNMSFHKLEHQEKRTKLTCPHCPAQIAHQKNLTRHIKTVHLKIVVKTCEICGKEFTTKNTYVAHMDAHHYSGEAFECSVCLKKFKHATNLRQHAYAMHNRKRFSCAVCDKSFKSSNLLSSHQRVHSTDQPYGCSQCTKRFKSAFSRNTHELTHSGIQFKCTLCERSYRYKSLLSMHIKKQHSEETMTE